jgi:hypothetical protein
VVAGPDGVRVFDHLAAGKVFEDPQHLDVPRTADDEDMSSFGGQRLRRAMDPVDERAGRVDEFFARSFQTPPFPIADAVGGDHHEGRRRDRLPVTFVGTVKPKPIETREDALIMDELAVNRDVIGPGRLLGHLKGIAHAKAEPERVGENYLHGRKLLMTND